MCGSIVSELNNCSCGVVRFFSPTPTPFVRLDVQARVHDNAPTNYCRGGTALQEASRIVMEALLVDMRGQRSPALSKPSIKRRPTLLLLRQVRVRLGVLACLSCGSGRPPDIAPPPQVGTSETSALASRLCHRDSSRSGHVSALRCSANQLVQSQFARENHNIEQAPPDACLVLAIACWSAPSTINSVAMATQETCACAAVVMATSLCVLGVARSHLGLQTRHGVQGGVGDLANIANTNVMCDERAGQMAEAAACWSTQRMCALPAFNGWLSNGATRH